MRYCRSLRHEPGSVPWYVRRASHKRERITITDHGQPAAVLINPQELADPEDALAVAEYRARQAAGPTAAVPHDEVRARLGPERG